MQKLLIIDDDTELIEMLSAYLEAEGFSVSAHATLKKGVESALSGEFDLAILDLGLPDGSGLDFLARVRKQSNLPVLILTGRSDTMEKVVGLEMGADDYVPKPFEPRELLARVRALLRRAAAGGGRAPRISVAGDLELDRAERCARRAKNSLGLTQTEFAILDLLMRANGAVVERERIVAKVFGRESTPFDRSLDVHMSNLRRKIGQDDVEGGSLVGTMRGVGYFIRMPGNRAAGIPQDSPQQEKEAC